MGATRRVTSADGTAIAVYESGPASGPVVVAVHGYPDNHGVWDGMAAELGSRFRVVRYDVRGAGDSDAPRGRAAYRIDRLLDDLTAVLDAVARRPVHLLGHDWGAVQSWPALTDPRLAGRIATFTSISGPALEHAARWLRAGPKHPIAAVRQLAASYYTAVFQLPAIPEAAIRAGLMDRAVARTIARGDQDEPPRRRAEQLNGLNLYRANMLAGLGRRAPQRIDVPVQVIAPCDDPFVTVALATQAPAPYVTNLRTEVIRGGHWVPSEHPDVVAGCFLRFLDEVATNSGTAGRTS